MSHLKKISAIEFKQTIEKGFVLVDFYADWCGPCRVIAPQLEILAEELQGIVTIGKFDIEDDTNIPSTYQVTSIPTLILFSNGKEIMRRVGLCDIQEIKKIILHTQK